MQAFSLSAQFARESAMLKLHEERRKWNQRWRLQQPLRARTRFRPPKIRLHCRLGLPLLISQQNDELFLYLNMYVPLVSIPFIFFLLMPLLTNYYLLRIFLFNDISKWVISMSFCYSESKPHLSPLCALAHISSYYMQIFRVTEANSWLSSLVFLEL